MLKFALLEAMILNLNSSPYHTVVESISLKERKNETSDTITNSLKLMLALITAINQNLLPCLVQLIVSVLLKVSYIKGVTHLFPVPRGVKSNQDLGNNSTTVLPMQSS